VKEVLVTAKIGGKASTGNTVAYLFTRATAGGAMTNVFGSISYGTISTGTNETTRWLPLQPVVGQYITLDIETTGNAAPGETRVYEVQMFEVVKV